MEVDFLKCRAMFAIYRQWLLSTFLKDGKDNELLILNGRLFHSFGAAT